MTTKPLPSPQYEEILALLLWGPGTVRVIARGTSLSASAVSNRISYLEKNGFIETVLRCTNGGKVWAISPQGAAAIGASDIVTPLTTSGELRRAATVCELMVTDEENGQPDAFVISGQVIDAELLFDDAPGAGRPDLLFGDTGYYKVHVMPTATGVPIVATWHTPTYVHHHPSSLGPPTQSVAQEVLWHVPNPLMLRATLQAYKASGKFASLTVTCMNVPVMAQVRLALDQEALDGWATVRGPRDSADLRWKP